MINASFCLSSESKQRREGSNNKRERACLLATSGGGGLAACRLGTRVIGEGRRRRVVEADLSSARRIARSGIALVRRSAEDGGGLLPRAVVARHRPPLAAFFARPPFALSTSLASLLLLPRHMLKRLIFAEKCCAGAGGARAVSLASERTGAPRSSLGSPKGLPGIPAGAPALAPPPRRQPRLSYAHFGSTGAENARFK